MTWNTYMRLAKWGERVEAVVALMLLVLWLMMTLGSMTPMTGGPFDPSIPQTEWFAHAIQYSPEYVG